MNLPVVENWPYEEVEVLVAGGGMAGIAAAVAAARSGARTVLVEKAGWLGGMGATGATGLHSFFNIFDPVPGAERMRVAGGIAQELVDRLQVLGGGIGHVRMERGGDFVSMLTPLDPEVFRLAAFQLCREAGVRLLLHCLVDEVRSSSGLIEGVVVAHKGGRWLIPARIYIDCTGDGDLSEFAGAQTTRFHAGERGAYSAGFTFRLCNVDLQRLEADLERRGLISQLAHAVKPGMSQPDLVRLGIHMGRLREQGVAGAPRYFLSSSIRPHELTYVNCINYGPNDGLDTLALSEAEVYLRGAMFDIVELFRHQFDGCQHCYPAGAAPSAGQRRGRAVRCEYELNMQDCTGGAQFEDQVGCFSFIDNSEFFVKDAGAYGIPYRALIPRGMENLLIAGRMMTFDLVAHNSTRNTVCCLVCGQAAGTAAALSLKQGGKVREVAMPALRHALQAGGALLQPIPDPISK